MNFNNYAEKILSKNNNFTFSPHSNFTISTKECFSNSGKSLNKSAFSNYINLNKSQYYYNGNKIRNISSFKINNYNNSMYIKNNIKDNSKNKKSIVKIRLSNNNIIPDFYFKNFNVNNQNSNLVEYSNNAIINKHNKIISEKNRYKHYYSYKNLTIPNKFNSSNNLQKNNCYIYKNLKNQENENITERNYNYEDKDFQIIKNQKEYDSNSRLIDEQILDYLNKNGTEKENIIKKMEKQKIYLKKSNKKNKENIINLNKLNNYSYVNNNYNYYCTNGQYSTYDSNNINNNNLKYYHNYTNNNIILKKSQIKNTIYSNYQKKQVEKEEHKKYPVRINYTNENINIENIFDNEPILNKTNEKTKNIPSHFKFKNLNKIDYYSPNLYDINYNNSIYSSSRSKIPTPTTKITLSKRNKLYNENARNTVNIIYKSYNSNNIMNDHYDTDRTLSSNYTLNGINVVEKKHKPNKYKNKISKSIGNKQINRNIIQKSLDLFFNNQRTNKNEQKIISLNERINKSMRENGNNKNDKLNKKEKKEKIKKIPSGLNQKKNRTSNHDMNKNNNNNNKKIHNLNKLKVSSNVINEQFNKNGKRESISEKESESSRFSVQSMNDSKLMELASKYITDEELNREEIIDILNSKKENNK